MQGYKCIYYKKIGKDLFIQNRNTACWAGLVRNSEWKSYNKKYVEKSKKSLVPLNIYIDIKSRLQSYDNIKQLVYIMNKITNCSIIHHYSDRNYREYPKFIKYKLVKNKCYRSNMLLLHIIRQVWYNPYNFNNTGFFNSLHEFKEGDDPLLFLTTKLRDFIKEIDPYGYGNHCMIVKGIIPKTLNEFMNSEIDNAHAFLQTKNKDLNINGNKDKKIKR